jgi:hypothetical protein
VRTALAVFSLLLVAAMSMASHWGGPVSWETDALFYQSKSEEIGGADAAAARQEVFGGPLSAYERGIEADHPDEPARVSDPAWVEYSSTFYARRLLLPALAVVIKPIFGLRSLQILSLLGFVLVPALLFLLLRRRLPFAISIGVAAAVILWPPLRAWAVFPLTDSSGLALLIAALLCALLTIERGRRWLAPWFACVLALAFTRDIAFIPVIAALSLLVARRDRASLGLAGIGILAALPALFVHGVSESKELAYVFSNHTIPTDTSWAAVLPKYPSNFAQMLGRYGDYAAANPLVVLIALGGIVASFALAPRRDTLTILLWSTVPGYMLLMAVGPAFSGFRYELVLVPLIAYGYGHLAERVLRRVGETRGNRELAGGAVRS